LSCFILPLSIEVELTLGGKYHFPFSLLLTLPDSFFFQKIFKVNVALMSTCFGAFVFVIQINTYFIYIFVVGKFGLVPVARSRMKFIGGFGLLAPCETIVATYCELCVFLHFQVALEVVPVNRVLSLKTGRLLVARIQFDFCDLNQLRVEAW